jgi:molybdate transport system ATP-binding protein
MSEIKHWVIFGIGISAKSDVIQNLLSGKISEPFVELKGKNGVLFSTFTLEQFIREEAIHDDFSLSGEQKRSIRTFSNGEQKKALLDYLLSKNPDFLILDNAFDMLDVDSQKVLKNRLLEISKQTSILQIFKRKDNLLPFIQYAIEFENEKVIFSGTIQEHFQKYNKNNFLKQIESLPPAANKLELPDNPLIEFKNVSVQYGDKQILNRINWEITNGDFWQLKGPNGSGKTTLLTMITGDNPKAYGQDLTLFGRKKGSGESIWDIKKKIGYVTPSMTTLFRGWNSVEKMVVSGLVDSIGLYQKPTDYQKHLAGKWIDLIGLKNEKHTRFMNLTEGQQCMVLIARAMIKHPPLLILDEPAHGLDDENALILTLLVNKIAAEGQTTIIYVSHRKEPGLEPTSVYELIPGENGSEGFIRMN